jgi:hypothetical protein
VLDRGGYRRQDLFLLCFGPNRGRKTTYTSPPLAAAVADDPMRWLLTRHLHAFGPSTPERFANWLNTPLPWAKTVFTSTDLTPVTVDGNQQLVNGVVGGLWHQKRATGRVAITVEPFTRLTTRRRQALEKQVTRIGEILDATPTMAIGQVTVGGHA